ncbi:hypothetical protein GE21DRAFT_3863 [Neurospora crassa]|uniref:Uncharacterized protein n=1 Tax=Neurospora crassa (strain ATCC 24698 / 74-OR23-1A / CBS 708.71 / DSM 1257 / FGSC 987) TaxID=367110 RepID=Q7SAT9_NEUCR|nr:hypothetical protein NCU05660 [Neurospora crassa OR74A]EAA33512.1 hypothetical protein NCU05660 [Neurospora crassa OR74A]KHE78345.1 hypothetical protein GE21DRAFT_3863 [Neurospora crassa]|eukprot:XP_962748.1 hypothetical protein NCU05660 [Neurospora crassa OR74A]
MLAGITTLRTPGLWPKRTGDLEVGSRFGPSDKSWIVWKPEDGYPTRGITLERLFARLQRKRGKLDEEVEFQREAPVSPDYPEVKIFWAENWAGRSSEVTMDRVRGTEKILREEAHRLGFQVVIVRSGVHNETNQYAEDGTVLTYVDQRTGRTRNLVAEDDPHMTIYLGYDLDHIVVQGHVYIVWDTKASFNMRIVRNASDRKIVQPWRQPVASEYWYL